MSSVMKPILSTLVILLFFFPYLATSSSSNVTQSKFPPTDQPRTLKIAQSSGREETTPEDTPTSKGNKQTNMDKKAEIIKTFRHIDSSKSDAEIYVYLEKVKLMLKKRSEKAVAALKNKTKTNKEEAQPLFNYDAIKGMPKSFEELNKDLLDYLFEGDIFLTLEQLVGLDVVSNRRTKRKTMSDTSARWPTADKGVIAYSLSPSLTNKKIVMIKEAIKFWEDNACFKFEPANGSGVNGLRFVSENGCWSLIGMVGGMQPISIGDGCDYFDVVAHEIGHALGFWHEHQRYDRDEFIQINTQNIVTGEESNFEKARVGQLSPFTTPYDYGSIMHYASDAFSVKIGTSTITARDTLYQQVMGASDSPSFYDVREMNYFYNCNASCALSNTICQNGGYPDPKDCSKCKCPSAFGGQLCDRVQSAENVNCGGILTASTSMQTLNVTIGGDDVLLVKRRVCYWHIESPSGTTVEVTMTNLITSCIPGCYSNFLELKMGHPTGIINGINIQSPFEGVGYRFCCKDDHMNVPFTSKTSLVPVIAYAFFGPMEFVIKYRLGGQLSDFTTTPSTTTTTTTTTTKTTTPTTLTTTSTRTTNYPTMTTKSSSITTNTTSTATPNISATTITTTAKAASTATQVTSKATQAASSTMQTSSTTANQTKAIAPDCYCILLLLLLSKLSKVLGVL